jgi:predicted ATPase/class 3 adenylate cyclase
MIESVTAAVTYLFSDIEGSTRLWEADPARAARTLAWHDELSRAFVQRHGGTVVKMTGDGVHAVFDDPARAVAAVIDLQLALAEPGVERAPLSVRCGLHLGADQRRDKDFYGPAVNRAARIMGAAHGGQVLISQAVADSVTGRLPLEVALRDLGLVRLRDLGSPKHIFQIVHPALRKDFPPLRSMASTPNNLCQQLNSFVGRDKDMEEVLRLLANSRLLTLLGMGGLGKSRLSVQVAAVVLDNYPDGVWFVELAALSDPRLVPQALASALGVKEEPGGKVMDAVARFVRDKQLLIILDNCEHVVQASAELAKRLLEAGPKVQVLASSRDSLRIAGEIVFPVAPLPAPEKDGMPSVNAMMAIDSVRLFIDRAKAVQPALHLSEDSVRAVAEICRRLDGIPLAIELAAARVRAMSVQQIAARLDDRFRLLNRGDRTAFPRQQTLRALIDWSHDLLDPRERKLFRRLAVFAGGWTHDAAESVCAGDDADEVDLMNLLAELVDKSLVVREADGGRYGFLETVRLYALEWLARSGDEDTTRSRHLAYFLEFAEQAAPELIGPDQPAALRRLDLEHDNILSAHGYCVRRKGAAEQACRLVLAVKHYWFMRGLFNLAYQMTVEVVSISPVEPDSATRCEALWVAGQICSYTGRYEEAQRYLHESLAIARRHGDRRMIVNVENFLSLASLGQGDRAAARHHCSEALKLARELGGKLEMAVAANALAQLNRLDGELDGAEPLYEEVVALAHELGIKEFIALGILGLAMVAIGRQSPAHARELLQKALKITEETGSKPAGQSALEVAAGLAALEKDADRFARLYGAAEAQMLRTGIRRDPADQAFLQPLLAESRAALGETRFTSAEMSGRAMPFDQALAEVRSWLSARG